MSDITKQDIIAFLEARFLCTIATVGKNLQPEAAFVAYVSNDNLEVIIGTSDKSRKYKNLTENHMVALVIADMTGEVQYEGKAEIITQENYELLIAENSFGKLSGFDKYRTDPTQVYLKINPTWLRFIVHGDPDQIVELTEFA